MITFGGHGAAAAMTNGCDTKYLPILEQRHRQSWRDESARNKPRTKCPKKTSYAFLKLFLLLAGALNPSDRSASAGPPTQYLWQGPLQSRWKHGHARTREHCSLNSLTS